MTDDRVTTDKRPITAVYLPDPFSWVAADDITIEAYDENGEMAPVPWIRVKQSGQVIARFHASKAVIRYD